MLNLTTALKASAEQTAIRDDERAKLAAMAEAAGEAAAAAAEAAAGNQVPQRAPEPQKNLQQILGNTSGPIQTSGDEVYEKGYKHANIAHFQVGRFVFKDHILILRASTPEALAAMDEDFLKAAVGLEPRDKVAISELRNVQNETPLMDRLASRRISGAVGTRDINAPIAGVNAGNKEKPVA
jgi:hypothetical protein